MTLFYPKAVALSLLLLGQMFFLSISLLAQEPSRQKPPRQSISQEERHQLNRQQALEEQLSPKTGDVRLLSKSSASSSLNYPEETPCFRFHSIALLKRELFPSIEFDDIINQSLNVCLGGQGINLLMSILQNRLIESGYVTTRVLAPAQDLTGGMLQLTIVPGKVASVQLSDKSKGRVSLPSTLPVTEDQLLNLKDIEQGLENLQRHPFVNASFELLPGDNPGESNLVVNWQQERRWRGSITLDDSGSDSTGKQQANAMLFVDSPFFLSDQFFLSFGSDFFSKSRYGTENWASSYSVPFGYWMLGLSANGNDYFQTISGVNVDYQYAGDSQTLGLFAKRVLRRSNRSKTSLSFQLSERESHNYVDDIEVEIQRRHTTAWQLGLSHRQFFDNGTLDIELVYRKGTRWFGAIPAPEELSGAGTALVEIIKPHIIYSLPFTWGEQQWRYDAKLKGQWTDTRLTPIEQFSIGNRWSVRGFDGELTLTADRGWLMSNELAWMFSTERQSLYLGLDHGEVSGKGTERLSGTSLTGVVVGLRGSLSDLHYELFAGKPLSKPEAFDTDDTVTGFSFNWAF